MQRADAHADGDGGGAVGDEVPTVEVDGIRCEIHFDVTRSASFSA